MNDNGPNALLKAEYGDAYCDWQLAYPGVPYSVPYFNTNIALAYGKFSAKAGSTIINAAEKCG